MSGHSMPISSSLIGSQVGHLNEAPSAAPTLRKTPKLSRVLNSPLPLKAKLRASPPISSDPARTSAPTDVKETRSFSVPSAPVSSRKSTAVIVSTEPSVIFIVSAENLKAENWPAANTTDARTASVLGACAVSPGSRPSRSVSVAEIGLPGRKRAPPEAK